MHDIDKSAFAAFLAQLRRDRGLTQKDLAEKLFVSDKAVSKWERGLSLPDISLLIPLAEVLGVTVTELLEGKRMPEGETIPQEQVEKLLNQTIHLADGEKGMTQLRKRRIILYGAVLVLVGIEWLITGGIAHTGLNVLEGLTIGFGFYFWCFMKDRLPDYYDSNRISSFSDGPIRMNVPGICFNNGNWPYMVKFLRIWTAAAMILLPLLGFLLSRLGADHLTAQMAVLVLYLASLFVPLYIIGRKYDLHRDENRPWYRDLTALLPILLLIGILLVFQGPATSRSALRIGFIESGDWQQWQARYKRLDGTLSRSMRPEETDYLLTVETEQGTVDITILSDGEVTYSEDNIPTGSWPLNLEGTVRVTVTAEDHKGSFSIVPAP